MGENMNTVVMNTGNTGKRILDKREMQVKRNKHLIFQPCQAAAATQTPVVPHPRQLVFHPHRQLSPLTFLGDTHYPWIKRSRGGGEEAQLQV